MTAANKPVIGLTGGIASGKSTVARQLAALGVAVIDADGLAREVVLPGSTGLAEVVQAFGAEMLTPDGELDRERVAGLVFNDPEARKRLNGIIHPRIGQLSVQRIVEAQHSGTPYIVYEAPLLVETGAHRGMAALIVVAADSQRQLQRVQSRDAMTEAAAQARISAQLPLESKIAVADYVIHNDGALSDLVEQTAAVHAKILERFELAGVTGHIA